MHLCTCCCWSAETGRLRTESTRKIQSCSNPARTNKRVFCFVLFYQRGDQRVRRRLDQHQRQPWSDRPYGPVDPVLMNRPVIYSKSRATDPPRNGTAQNYTDGEEIVGLSPAGRAFHSAREDNRRRPARPPPRRRRALPPPAESATARTPARPLTPHCVGFLSTYIAKLVDQDTASESSLLPGVDSAFRGGCTAV